MQYETPCFPQGTQVHKWTLANPLCARVSTGVRVRDRWGILWLSNVWPGNLQPLGPSMWRGLPPALPEGSSDCQRTRCRSDPSSPRRKKQNNQLVPDTQTHVKHFWTQNQSQCVWCNNTSVDLSTCFYCYSCKVVLNGWYGVARMFWVNVVVLLYCSGWFRVFWVVSRVLLVLWVVAGVLLQCSGWY